MVQGFYLLFYLLRPIIQMFFRHAEVIYDKVSYELSDVNLAQFDLGGETYTINTRNELPNLIVLAMEGILLLNLINVIRKSRLT